MAQRVPSGERYFNHTPAIPVTLSEFPISMFHSSLVDSKKHWSTMKLSRSFPGRNQKKVSNRKGTKLNNGFKPLQQLTFCTMKYDLSVTSRTHFLQLKFYISCSRHRANPVYMKFFLQLTFCTNEISSFYLHRIHAKYLNYFMQLVRRRLKKQQYWNQEKHTTFVSLLKCLLRT